MKRVYIFDMDNTLYLPQKGTLERIDSRIRKYIRLHYNISREENIQEMRKTYFFKYGSSMLGLMKDYNLDPYHYLQFIHDIEDEYLPEYDHKVVEILKKVNGRKVILTNSYKKYALRILKKLGILDLFEDVFDVVDMNFLNKSHNKSYQMILDLKCVKPEDCVMHDDIWRFLEVPKKLGITTVLVNEKYEGNPDYSINSIYELPDILGSLETHN